MNNQVFTVFADLTTMGEVAKFEALLTAIGIEDKFNRPMYYANRRQTLGSEITKASVFIYVQDGITITSGFDSISSDQKYKLTPDQLYAVLKIIQHA